MLVALMGMSSLAMAQLPALSLKTTDGRTLKMDELRNDGKPFVIAFFATWCKPCNRELSAIADEYEDWQKETGVKIFPVSIDKAQNVEKVAPLVAENGWPYETVILDPNSEFSRAMGVQMIPFQILLDKDGQIVYKHNGYVDGAEDELLEEIRKLK